MQVEIPAAFEPLLATDKRYVICYGGRGGGRSWAIARALLVKSLQSTKRILCAREFQVSIAKSVHKLLSDQIDQLQLDAYFNITKDIITSINGSEFSFLGLHNNIQSVKSIEGIDIAWVEEAENVSKSSWDVLIPTIRKPQSQIFISFNPSSEDDPTVKRFVFNPPFNSVQIKTTFRDNPYFPDVLEEERIECQRLDLELYQHIWEGDCKSISESQIFRGKCVVEPVIPGIGWFGPYYGTDWGFANDPTVMTKSWINGRKLMIENEILCKHTDIDKIPGKFNEDINAHKYTIRADCSRPETISYMRNHGYPKMIGCKKWPQCVEDGITFLRSYEQIVIDPRCVNTIQEARLYKYKVDKLTGDILPDIVDAHNHSWDSVRYSLEPLIMQRKPSTMQVMN